MFHKAANKTSFTTFFPLRICRGGFAINVLRPGVDIEFFLTVFDTLCICQGNLSSMVLDFLNACEDLSLSIRVINSFAHMGMLLARYLMFFFFD